MIKIKSEAQIDIMDEVNHIVHDVLDKLEAHVSIGMATIELDKMAEDIVFSHQAKPAFKGYMGFPNSICISINEEIVHGIPGNRIIKDGDIISIDFGAVYKGFVGDAAKTFIVGNNIDKYKNLIDNTKLALKEGISKMCSGNRMFDVSRAISKIAKNNKYGNVKKYCGHGIGEKMHEEPWVFNYVAQGMNNIHLREGMVFALEPMFSLGKAHTKILDDRWTVITTDNEAAAHWEASVAITKDGPRILGKPDL